MTVQNWIDETRDMLLSGYVEELLTLASPINAEDTSFTIDQADTSGIVGGVVIEIGIEAMYVQSITGSTLTVIRGYGSSTPASRRARSPRRCRGRECGASWNLLRITDAPSSLTGSVATRRGLTSPTHAVSPAADTVST